jgi:hypothetical protein
MTAPSNEAAGERDDEVHRGARGQRLAEIELERSDRQERARARAMEAAG